jgi:hypothetical protein
MPTSQLNAAYTGTTCRRDGCDEPPVDPRGPFKGLCAGHKAEASAEAARRRAVTMAGKAPNSNGAAAPAEEPVRREMPLLRPPLVRACNDLAAVAQRLEDAIDERDAARIHANTLVGEFRAQLQVVGRAAQSLVNTDRVRQDAARKDRV